MVASQDETVAGAAPDRLHALPVSLDARGFGIVESPTMHRAPEIGVQFEIRAPPVFAHGAEDLFKMLLHFRMRPIQRVPGSVPPPCKRYLAGQKRLIVCSADEPIRVLLKNVGILLGDEGCNPDCWFKAAQADLFQYRDNISAERLARFQPVAHCGLVAIVNL